MCLLSAVVVGAALGSLSHESTDADVWASGGGERVRLPFVAIAHLTTTVGNGRALYAVLVFGSLWLLQCAGTIALFSPLASLWTCIDEGRGIKALLTMLAVVAGAVFWTERDLDAFEIELRVGSSLLPVLVFLQHVALHLDYGFSRFSRRLNNHVWRGRLRFYVCPAVCVCVWAGLLVSELVNNRWQATLLTSVPLGTVAVVCAGVAIRECVTGIPQPPSPPAPPMPEVRRSSIMPPDLLTR